MKSLTSWRLIRRINGSHRPTFIYLRSIPQTGRATEWNVPRGVVYAMFGALLLVLSVLSGSKPYATAIAKELPPQIDGRACATCQPPTPQIIYAPLFDLPEAASSEIVLNCRSARDIAVTPTFYALDGTAYVGEVITLHPAEMKFVETKKLIPLHERNRRNWGGISFSYEGNMMEFWAQLTLHGHRSGSANILFTVVAQRRSNIAEAVWRTSRNGAAVLALGNSSGQTVRAELAFAGGETRSIEIAPFATEIIRPEATLSSTRGAKVGSVRLTYSGLPGSLIPTGFTMGDDGNLAGIIRFYDTVNVVQPNLYANNLRLKDSVPHLVLKNTAANPIKVHPRFLTASGRPGEAVELSSIELAPNEVREVNLRPLTAAAVNRADLNSVSVQIINSGAAGSLIGSLYTKNNKTGVDYELPLRDSGPPRGSAGGYPVRLDGDYTTIVSITSTSEKAGEFTLQVNYEGGTYTHPIMKIEPGETKTFDVRKLRDQRMLDSKGESLPATFTVGQIRWSMRGNGSVRLIGRAEVVSLTDGVSSSYSCGICCPQSFHDGSVIPLEPTIFVGGSRQLQAVEQERDCYGNIFGPYDVSWMAGWDSLNPGIAWMGYNGMAYASAGGTTQISSTWPTYIWMENLNSQCEVIEAPYTEPAYIDVATAEIAEFQAVGKAGTKDVQITVTNNVENVNIVLTITHTGSGDAQFGDGSTTKTIQQSQSVQLKGITESNNKDNFTLTAKLESDNSVLDTEVFSVAKIKITRNSSPGGTGGTDVTDQTTTTIVGQRHNLTAEIVPSGITISDHQWALAGSTIEKFERLPANSSSPTTGNTVAVSGLQTNAVTFVWHDGSLNGTNRQVDYTATVDEAEIKAKSTFTVKRPTTTVSTSQSGTTIVAYNGPGIGVLLFGQIRGGSVVKQGIKITRSNTTDPPNFSGTYRFVQTAVINTIRTPSGGSQIPTSLSGLDGCFPYSAEDYLKDIPSIFLASATVTLQYAKYSGAFDTYLMFKPSGADSEWVPLKLLQWSWVGEATLIPNSNPFQWTPNGITEPGTPAGTDTTTYPSWTSLVPAAEPC